MVLKEKSPSLGHQDLWLPDGFKFIPVFKGQPVCGFTSNVFVELPGRLEGNKRNALLSWCGPHSPSSGCGDLLGLRAGPDSPALLPKALRL